MVFDLKKITGYKNWHEVNGPNSRCGIDYWYECVDEDGEQHSAYINIDQGEMTVSLDGEAVWQEIVKMPKHKTKKTKQTKQAKQHFECPVCHASLRHERIDDGIIVHIISFTGQVEELVNKSDGGNRVYCSANEEHAIPHKLSDKVIDLCSYR